MRLLCVTAHPDDEAGSFGGSLLLYHERGVQTFVICLTAGQSATHRGSFTGEEELASVRRREFEAACEHLKVTKGEVLNYFDGRLDRENIYGVVEQLVLRMRQIRPHVVMTFGSEGAVTAHPDHSMACIFATLAFQWAGRANRYVEQRTAGPQPWRPQKLYYATTNFTLPDRQPVALAPASAFIRIGPENLERKIEAFKKHTTQSPLFKYFEAHVRKREDEERFLLAAKTEPSDLKRETDLFEGVKE